MIFLKTLGLALFLASASLANTATPFRFHLVSEPASLKPWEQKNSSAGYLLSQITGTLLTYQDRKLQPNLAEKCSFQKPTLVRCQLRKNIKWNSGKAITAADFVRGFQSLIDPKNKAFRADLLFPVANAVKVFKGQAQKKDIQVKAPSERVLEIELTQPDSEFLYTLTSPLLAPLPASPLPNVVELRGNPALWMSSGAYEIQSWEAQKKITLKPNSHFWKKGARPSLEVIPISEDSVALNLYEKGELSFLRRLPTLFIPKYKGRPDFFEIEQIRFDYLGFAPRWRELQPLRRAISRALPYAELQALYQAKGTPGCPGIPESLAGEKVCLIYDPVEAQSEWQPLRGKPEKFEIGYSKQGGDDHKRSMEWVQAELKKNLNLRVELNGLENQIFIEKLEKNPPDLFRKGIAPERPTCLSALENFETGNSENYIQFSDPRFDEILKKMRTISQDKPKQKLCAEALHLLIDPAWIIPTGPIHFTLLAQESWTGWKLNELNQLDLSELRWKPSAAAGPDKVSKSKQP